MEGNHFIDSPFNSYKINVAWLLFFNLTFLSLNRQKTFHLYFMTSLIGWKCLHIFKSAICRFFFNNCGGYCTSLNLVQFFHGNSEALRWFIIERQIFLLSPRIIVLVICKIPSLLLLYLFTYLFSFNSLILFVFKSESLSHSSKAVFIDHVKLLHLGFFGYCTTFQSL